MDPQIPVPPPGTPDLTPAMYGAIGYILLAFGHWAAKNGLPWVQQALGMVSARDKELAAQAKEGPIMVLERVERELKENKEALASVLAELKDVRKQHFDCEKKHAELTGELKVLRREVGKIKGEEHNEPEQQ